MFCNEASNVIAPLILIGLLVTQLYSFSPHPGERQEVHVAVGQLEASRHRGRIHEPTTHVRHLQPGRQKRLQGLVNLIFFVSRVKFEKPINAESNPAVLAWR